MEDELFKMSGPVPTNFDAENADNLEDVRHCILLGLRNTVFIVCLG